MQLIQIVPRVRPRDGVGDYAARLAGALQERHGVSTRFVEAGGAEGRAALSAALQAAEDGTSLLLHYVGYGYAPRGAPLWLARALARARRGPGFGVVFHELYATGRPWHSSFWLSGLQKHIVTRIARQCRFALLTREANRQWLEATGALAGKQVSVLPISSNVGEPREVSSVRDRLPVMVVWGSARARAVLYGNHGAWLGIACRAFGVSKIVDIGPSAAPASVGGVAIEARGPLPAEQLSHALLTARCGVLACPASFLAKSTIFAAYAAHGVVPLVLDEPRTVALDELVAGRHFLRLSADRAEGLDGAPFDEIAGQVRAWYAGHTTVAHAGAVWRMLAQVHP